MPGDLFALPIRDVVRQHASDAAWRWQTRRRFARQFDCRLTDLAIRDDNIQANLDGLSVADSAGWEIALQQFDQERDPGEAFAALALALSSQSEAWITAIVRAAVPEIGCHRGLIGALAWVGGDFVERLRFHWLTAPSPVLRLLALAACAHVRHDPGAALPRLLDDPDPQVRARAARAAGELGRLDLAPALSALLADPACRFWAAWSSVLLGDRSHALDQLRSRALTKDAYDGEAWRALELTLSALDLVSGHQVLKSLMEDDSKSRHVVKGCGWSGNPAYIPWLLEQLSLPSLAQTATAALNHIVGLDIRAAGLEGQHRTLNEAAQRELDQAPEADWPWPDPAAIKAGWPAQQADYPGGTRHLFGVAQREPLDPAQLAPRLMATPQAERERVATMLCVAQPGCLLFPVHAPSRVQYRLFRQAIGDN